MADNYVDQAPGQMNLGIYQGDDFQLAFLLKSGSPSEAIDLTGATGLSQIRMSDGSNTLLKAFTVTPDADQTLNTGVLVITLSASDAATLSPANEMWWDLQLTQGGITRTYLKGTVVALAEVSKP